MARLVKHTAKKPAMVETDGKPIFVCRCGLSKNSQGLCDGSHKVVADESDDELCCYDKDLSRKKVKKNNHDCDGNCCHD